MIESFKIGITVGLINHASGALALLGRDLSRADGSAQKLEASLKRIQMMTFGGAALAGAGFLGIKGIESTYEAAKTYEQAFARFQALNLGVSVNSDADKFAQSTRIMGASATDLITTLTDLHTVMGDFNNAKAVAPLIAKMEFANKAVFDKAGVKFDQKQALDLAKVIELRGGFRSSDEMMLQADFSQHVMSGTGGRVMPSDYLSFLGTGGVPARLQSNDVFYYQMEPLIQAMKGGGSAVGAGLRAAYQNLGQGRTTTRSAKELERLDLLKPNMVEYDKIGRVKQIKPGGVKGGDLVGSDPMEFLKTVLLPAFAAHGITSDKDIINEFATVFSNPRAAALYSTLFQQMDKIDKNMAINRKAAGITDLEKQAENTPAGVEIKAEKAWENLRIQLGLKIIPLVVPMIDKLANGLQFLAGVAERHPTATAWIMGTAGALSVLALAGGSALLVAAGFSMIGLALPGLAIGLGSMMPHLAAIGLIIGGTIFIAKNWESAMQGYSLAWKYYSKEFVRWWEWQKTAAMDKIDQMKAALSEKWKGITDAWDNGLKMISSSVFALFDRIAKSLPNFMQPTAPHVEGKIDDPSAADDTRKVHLPMPPPLTTNTAIPPYYSASNVPPDASRADPSAGPRKVTIENNIHLDGRQIAKTTADHWLSEMNGPAAGRTSFDPRMSFVQP
jgi:hypothetical protein